jgi:hypothetical protein
MKLIIYNKKNETEQLDIKFSSFWGYWILAYLATMGVMLITTLLLIVVVRGFS